MTHLVGDTAGFDVFCSSSSFLFLSPKRILVTHSVLCAVCHFTHLVGAVTFAVKLSFLILNVLSLLIAYFSPLAAFFIPEAEIGEIRC